MKISSIAVLIITGVVGVHRTSVDAASCSVPTIKTEADCASFCQSGETSYFNGEAMLICQCIGADGGLYSTYGDECICPKTGDMCDGAGGDESSSTNGDLPTWCYDIPESRRSNVPECVIDGYPTWCADVEDTTNVPVCGGTGTGTGTSNPASNIQNTGAAVPTWCNNIPEPGRSNVPQCVASGKYPTWCNDVGDKTYVSACGGTGMNSDGMPAWCDTLDTKAKMCIAQCGGAFTSSCCDGMDAQTRQYVVGCNGGNSGIGGGGGGMGGGGGEGGTSNAVMTNGHLIISTSVVFTLAASMVL